MPSGAGDTDEDEPEPWYYRFIEKYVIAGMWIGIALSGLSFLGWTAWLFVVGANTSGWGGCAAFMYWAMLGVAHVLGVFALIYGCSWLLLALDAARNLRRIRLKLPSR